MKILVVDDDEVDRLAVARALRSAVLEVKLQEADSVAVAVTALTQATFDCVLLDYQLPGGDALDVLRAVAAAGLDTPIIILTGRGDEQTAVELMKAGASDYLPKHALSADRLAQSLRYVVECRQLQRERDLLLVRAEEARAEAEAANAAKDQFLATLSHELRTPLTAILGWATMLRDQPSDRPRMMRGLEVIGRNAELQAQLINDLLDVSRIVSGKLQLVFGSVDAAQVCDAVLDTVRPQLATKSIRVKKSLDRDAGRIAGDAARLQQVVGNLMSNAIKFSPSGGTIHLTLRRLQAAVEIVVADHGCGIAVDFLPHVFDRFRQGKPAGGSTAQGGLGLGLAIVRHIVELHGGIVRAESPGEGQGARFTVQLPVMAEVEVAAAARDSWPALPRLDGVRVLVVDDNPDARELVEAILTDQGASVATCSSKDDALAALQRERPDVFISDIEMPDGDGYEMIRALRLRDEDTESPLPAIALTGTTRAEDRIRMLSAGYQSHVPKPIDSGELVTTVAMLAHRERAARSDSRARRTRSGSRRL